MVVAAAKRGYGGPLPRVRQIKLHIGYALQEVDT
jgi:hypothetical protein